MKAYSKKDIIKSVFVIVVGALFALMFWPFFTPLLVAGLFAFALNNIIARLTFKFKKKQRVVLGVMLVFFLFFAVPTILITVKSIATIKDYSSTGFQNTPIYAQTETLLQMINIKFRELAASFNFNMDQLPQLSDLLPQTTTWLATQVTDALSQIPQKTLSFFVFIVALYFFLTESHKIKRVVSNLDLLQRSELNQIITIVQQSSYLTLFSSLVVGTIQALVVSIFAAICGFNEFLVIFVITFFFSLIPVIGAAPIAFFLSILSFFQGHFGSGVTLLVAAGIAGSIDNILKPMMLKSEEVHPALSLLALVGAILIYGPIGILLGPVLTSLVFKIGSILFPPVDSDENMT